MQDNRKPIYQKLNNKIVAQYDSTMDAVRAGFYRRGIQRCLSGNFTHHRGYQWEYVPIPEKVIEIKVNPDRGITRKNHQMYTIWRGIKARCYNTNSPAFKYYGGKGVKMCDKWKESFKSFLEDMGKRPSVKHSIDRIDYNGDYEPSNCRWATAEQQARNRSSNTEITHNGETKLLVEWADGLGTDSSSILRRIENGWDIGEALTRPVEKYNGRLDEDKIKELFLNGMKTGAIAKEINGKYLSVANKIFHMKKKGIIPNRIN